MTEAPKQQGPQFHARNVDQERKPLRSFSELRETRKDVDAQELGIRANALLAGIPGLVMGLFLGIFLVDQKGLGVWVVPLSMVAMAVGMTFTTLLLVNRAAAGGSKIYAPSGATTPRAKEYSYPESLAARGLYEEAVSAFELVVVEEGSSDPTPFLRIARIYRDQLQRYEDSARWFKRALAESDIHAGLAALTRKELVELYRTKLDQPEKAAPMLARLAEELAGTADGEWAAEELRFVKEQMREREGL